MTAPLHLEVETFSKYHIDTTMNKNKEDEWRFKGFYGELDTQKRHEAWAKLCSLKNTGPSLWLRASDFNEITKQNEKRGGRIRPHSQMQPLRNVLDECHFMDLGFVGSQYTWHKHFFRYTVWERLDRAVATNEWFSLFPGSKVHHLDATTLDHKPLLIAREGMDCHIKKPFRFEHMWMFDAGCSRTVESVWREDSAEPWGTKII